MSSGASQGGLPVSAAEVFPGEAPARLGKSLAARHVSMIAIGGIIGAGLFVGSSSAIAAAGPAVILSYLLAGAIVLVVMRMLSEMAVAIPGIQSFPEFARLGLGHWAGFLSGWLYWYFWVVVVAIEAIAGAVIIQNWVAAPVWLIGVGLMAMLTAVNLMSTRSYGEFEYWFSLTKVSGIVIFIAVTAAHVLGFGASGPAPGFANLVAHGGFAPNGLMAALATTTTVVFALVGAEIATIAAAESAEPTRTVARMTGSVALRILVFYVLSILLIVAVTPWTEIKPGVSPFVTALNTIGIEGAATVMNILVLIAVLSCLNSGLYVTSRVLFALAAAGDAPQALVHVNKRQVPVRAILITSSFSYAALAASVLSPETVFSFLVNASGALMLIIYLLIAAAQIRLRRLFAAQAPDRLSLKVWLFPGLSLLAMAAIIAILAAMAATPKVAVELWSSLVITAICLGLFAIFRRGKGGPLDPLAR